MSAKTLKQEAQNPLILRANRLMEAFTKSDDERDFYLDRMEGFIVYVDLEKPETDLQTLEKEFKEHADRYCLIPKLTFYEAKKIMEGFVNEKVYDIDTKEKLLDIIQSKEARENFLEFIYDHHSELEKWQQYYQERSRIRIIEWLRNNNFHFVFEEDLDLSGSVIEKLKRELFNTKPPKDILNARKTLISKAKTYYSSEALNPRPKRGRPPKQAVKLEIEPQITTDIYTTVPSNVRPFLFIPDITSASSVTFSSKFGTEEQLLASRRQHHISDTDLSLESINQKLASLRNIASKWIETEKPVKTAIVEEEEEEEIEDEFDLDGEEILINKKASQAHQSAITKKVHAKQATKKSPSPAPAKSNLKAKKPTKSTPPAKTNPPKRKLAPLKKIVPKPKSANLQSPQKKNSPPKKAPAVKKATPAKKPIAISKTVKKPVPPKKR